MHKRIAIGLIVLIFVLGVAIVFYHQYTDIQQLKEDAAQAKKLLEENDKPKVQHVASTSDTKPPDEPGYKWVRHGDHWDKVPVADQTHIVEVSNETPQQKEVVRPNFSVEGEVEFSQLPELPADIDPDEIPPFYSISESGSKYHYNRPLMPEEREIYNTLRADPSYDNATPAGIKMSAIILVRQQKKASGALAPIFQDLGAGRITGDEARILLDKFRERTRPLKEGE